MPQSLSPDLKEWTPEQKEVWKCLEHSWELLLKSKVDGFLEYIHPDFRGFGHESPLMLDKKWLAHWVGFWSSSHKCPIHYISPISCGVFEDLAILQYVIFTIEVGSQGASRSARRYTMTWVKEQKKWKILASHNNLMSENI